MQELEKKFVDFAEALPDPVLVIRHDGRIELANKQTEKCFGYQHKELIRHGIEILIPERFHSDHVELRNRLFKYPSSGPVRADKEWFGRRKDGSEIPIEISVHSFLSEGVLLVTVVIRDITERKKLVMEQVVLDHFFNMSLDMLCVAGVDGYFKRINPAFEQLGYSNEELLSKPFVEFVHPDDRNITLKEIEKLSTGIPTVGFENRYCLKDGSYRWLDWVSISDKTGTLYAVARDVTERKRIEFERDQALDAREELIAVVSHEIRNPLATITTSLDLIKRIMPVYEIKEGVGKLLEQIRAATSYMTRITSDLLDVTKIEAGRFSVEPTVVEVISLVEEVINNTQPIAAQRSIHVDKAVSLEAKAVVADKDRIIQVLSNLINNAIKFTSEGGSIRVEVERQQEKVLFQVKDTGCGIPKEQLSHVFERFWQAKRSQYLGSGLGLYIAKNIVEAHGGKMGVKSEEGEGSTFYFTLSATNVSEITPQKIA